MRKSHPRERSVGMAYYVSEPDGVGGRLRDRPEDFRVSELESFETEPVQADPGDYPFLVIRAELTGWDTHDFADRLANALGMSRERVRWAGTKDKHAITTQLFSLRGVDPDALDRISDVEIEVVGRAGRALEFGDLAGNSFDVIVREPQRPNQVGPITDELIAFGDGDSGEHGASTRSEGESISDGLRIAVPNYFGHQRFGSRRPVTHRVGLAIVRGEWERAVLEYLGGPTEAEPPGTRAARTLVDEGTDWRTALEAFPHRLGYERAMLHRLVETGGETPEDFKSALETVPSTLQRLFVHAAQSFVFNRILSERLRRGLPFHRTVTGDVVCFLDRGKSDGVMVPDPDRRQRVTADRLDTINRHCALDRAFVTAPLVGTETELGSGEVGDIERSVLDDIGIGPADFEGVGEFHSTGARRAIVVGTEISVERDPLRFRFALPKGAYATVVLREYLKTDPIEQ